MHQSNIQEYKDHGIDEDRTHTKKKDRRLDRYERENPFVDYDKYRGRTLKDYAENKKTIFPSRFIRIIKDLSSYRIHTKDDKDALLETLNTLISLPQKPEQSQNGNYNKNIKDINNENNIGLTDGKNEFQNKKN